MHRFLHDDFTDFTKHISKSLFNKPDEEPNRNFIRQKGNQAN